MKGLALIASIGLPIAAFNAGAWGGHTAVAGIEAQSHFEELRFGSGEGGEETVARPAVSIGDPARHETMPVPKPR